MKALLLAENWAPRIGGIERYLSGLVDNFSGETIEVITPKTSQTKDITDKKNVIRKKFFYPLIKPAWLPLYWQIRKRVKQEEIDILLCGKALFEGLLGYYLKKKTGTPYIVFTYAMEIEEWSKRAKTKRKLIKVLKEADKIICINEVTKKKLIELGVTKEKIKTIYPAVGDKFINAEKDPTIIKKYKLESPYIITVARLIKRKGIDDLIEAFANLEQTKFADLDLVVVGEGPEFESLQKLAKQEFLNSDDLRSSSKNRVKFLETVSDEELLALLAGAKLFALTPKNINGDMEGFGIVYLEASAAGLPVVGTLTGGVPKAVENGVTGFLAEENSPQSVTNKLSLLLSDPVKMKTMGDAGQQRVTQKFNWTNQSQLLKNVISHILAT